MSEDDLRRDLPEPLRVCIDEFRELLLAQTRCLDALIHDVSNDPGSVKDSERREVLNTVVLMLQGLGVSIHSCLRLTAPMDMAIRDAFGIARSATELAVNIAYIATGGVEVARRARMHALQKTYRDRQREGVMGGVRIEAGTVRPPVESIPGLADALAAFTDSKGRERRDWTDDSIDARISRVRQEHEQAALAMSGAVFAIYRHSSELLHGTYFSVVHFWSGSGGPPRPYTRGALARMLLNEHFVTIFTALFFAANGVIETMRDQFGLPERGCSQASLVSRARETTMRPDEEMSR